MKLFAPKYYKNFKCIADKCEHSCCIGWEIDIDAETLEKYGKMTTNYSKTIVDSIVMDGDPHFRLDKDERCPHLDENGLCRIIINETEGALCKICREHPRFYNFSGVAEVGIGMSCPEAARVILSSPDYADICKIGEIEANEDKTDFDGREERGKIYEILQDKTLDYARRLEKIYEKYHIDKGDDEKWIEIIDTLEYLDIEHKKLFLNYSTTKKQAENYETDSYRERFLAYFVYRHCTEAEDADDFCARLSFCLFCERLFSSLITACGDDSFEVMVKLASIISEEIEYSDENTWALTY